MVMRSSIFNKSLILLSFFVSVPSFGESSTLNINRDNATTGDAILNHDIFVFQAQTERLRAMGENTVRLAEADLSNARAEFVRSQDRQLRAKIAMLESMVAALKEDINFLLTVERGVNTTNRSICAAIKLSNQIKRDGQLWTSQGDSTVRLRAIRTLLSLDTIDMPIEVVINNAMTDLKQLPDFIDLISDDGNIETFTSVENKITGLDPSNFVYPRYYARHFEESNTPLKTINGFPGGSFFELINFLEDNHLELKMQRKAHRILGRVIVELEAQAIADIEKRIERRILPARTRILNFWAEFHNDANGFNSGDNNPDAGEPDLVPEPLDPREPIEPGQIPRP